MITNKAIKAWYSRALQSDGEYQLACSSYQNALDTFPEGETHPNFWACVWDSRQCLVDFAPQNYRIADEGHPDNGELTEPHLDPSIHPKPKRFR